MILETIILFSLFPQIPFFRSSRLKKVRTKIHEVNKSIENLNNFEFKENVLLTNRDKNLLHEIMTHYKMAPEIRGTCFSFVMLRYALDIETCSILKDMEMEHVKLKRKLFCSFKVDIQFNDDEWKTYSICLIPMNSFKRFSYTTTDKYHFAIEDYKNGKIYFEETTAINIKKLFHISFLSYSASYQASVKALTLIESYRLQKYFLEFDVAPVKCLKFFKDHQKVESFEWLDKRVATNNEQMMAIKNIVNCTAYPFPFIIFGPPGTGKTSTLIECVAQILQHKPYSRILITAQSNSACDEIGVRLIKAVDRKKVFRLYSNSQLQKPQSTEMRTELMKISNLRYNRINEVTSEQIYHFNVVISTLIKSNQLVNLKEEYFDYIFVDECASAAETECLVPIMGKIDNNWIILTFY